MGMARVVATTGEASSWEREGSIDKQSAAVVQERGPAELKSMASSATAGAMVVSSEASVAVVERRNPMPIFEAALMAAGVP
eukprot:scaffold175820_cov32-Tisochrysis_lutea.AAC.2